MAPKVKSVVSLLPMTVKQLRAESVKVFKDSGYEVRVEHGCILAQNPLAKTIRPLVLAHMDISRQETEGTPNPEYIWTCKHGAVSLDRNLGGDDRCGIWIAQKLAADTRKNYKHLRPHIILTCDEESGNTHFHKMLDNMSKKRKKGFDAVISFAIGLDRRGTQHYVCYSGGEDEFIEWVKTILPNWKKEYGSVSDLSVIQQELRIDGVNLAVGFYGEHHKGEYIRYADMNAAYKAARALVDEELGEVRFRIPERVVTTTGAGAVRHFRDEDFEFGAGYGHGYGGYQSHIPVPDRFKPEYRTHTPPKKGNGVNGKVQLVDGKGKPINIPVTITATAKKKSTPAPGASLGDVFFFDHFGYIG